MEEILVAIFQAAFELIFEIICYVPLDFPRGQRDRPEAGYGFLPAMAWLIAGGVLGGLSLLLSRHTFIQHAWVRIANLCVSPLLLGNLSRVIAAQRAKRDGFVIPSNHFWFAFTFSLAFTLIRFTYALRS